jgi:hypothetical protein
MKRQSHSHSSLVPLLCRLMETPRGDAGFSLVITAVPPQTDSWSVTTCSCERREPRHDCISHAGSRSVQEAIKPHRSCDSAHPADLCRRAKISEIRSAPDPGTCIPLQSGVTMMPRQRAASLVHSRAGALSTNSSDGRIVTPWIGGRLDQCVVSCAHPRECLLQGFSTGCATITLCVEAQFAETRMPYATGSGTREPSPTHRHVERNLSRFRRSPPRRR